MNLREKARRKIARKMAVEMLAQLRRAEEIELTKEMRAWSGARSALQRGYRKPVNRQAAKDLSS